MTRDAGLRGGVDLGGTKIQAAIVDAESEVCGAERLRTPTEGGPADIAAKLAEAVRAAAGEAGVEPASLEAIGVGSPGEVDSMAGTVSGARNLPGWEGSFKLAEHLEDDLGPPVRIGNDVDVAVRAEIALGAARPYRSALGVWWGTGVGGAVVVDRELWEGRGSAGEIGHMVIKRGGARCPCGRRGCMEAYAGRKAMEEAARRRQERGEPTVLFELMEAQDRDRLTSGIWERALDRGDGLAVALVERAIRALAAGVASAVNLLDPEAVILGGGLGDRLGPRYAEQLEARMARHLFVAESPPPLRIAELGDLGGAIGAALLEAPKDRA